MRDLIRLCRPYYAVPMALTFMLTVYYCLGGEMVGQWGPIAAATVALMLVIAAGYVLNDVLDAAIDRVNAPQRPVAAGRVRPRIAAAWGVGLMAAGLGLSMVGGWAFAGALAIVATALIGYDTFSKRLGPLKQLAVAALMTSIYPLALAQAGGATGPRAWTLVVFPVWMFLGAFGYEVLKDLRDLPGDPPVAGRPTPWARRPRRWRAIASAATVLGALALIGPAMLGCKWLYAMLIGVAIATGVASTRLPVRLAIPAIYVQWIIVGVAATADPLLLGF